MTNYTVESGQTRSGLVLYPNDTATVASGGTIVGTADGGAITLDGGRSLLTDILSGGSEAIANGGSASGTLVGKGGSLFISNRGFISGTIIESGGYVTFGNEVTGSGTSDFTLIDGGQEALYGPSVATNTLIENGGVQILEAGLAVARNTVIDKGGEQDAFSPTSGTVVNNGGLQSLNFGNGSYGFATGTIVNDGGEQLLDGGSSIGTVINAGGLQDAYSEAQGSVINGGTMVVEEMAETGYAAVTGGIQFTGTGGLLDLAGTTLTKTTISGFAPTDRIDFLNFGFTNTAKAALGAHNVLTIRGLTGGTATLMLNPTANYKGDSFKLASDGHGGTNLIVQAASCGAAPTLARLKASANAQGDPLGLQAAFTKTANSTAHSASAAGMTLPDPIGGSAHALAVLTRAASSTHVQILANHDMVATG